MLAGITGANEKYTTERYMNMHIAFIIQKSSECVWHVETYLKMLDFSKKQDKSSRLLRNMQRQVSFHIYRFEVIHVKCCARLYLVFVFRKECMFPHTRQVLLKYECYVYVYVSFWLYIFRLLLLSQQASSAM